MSDPVTTAEVEDVLSSIRRLVSEEKRPSAPAAVPPQPDRLVLTPALRVEDAPSDTPTAAEAEDGTEAIQAAFHSGRARAAAAAEQPAEAQIDAAPTDQVVEQITPADPPYAVAHAEPLESAPTDQVPAEPLDLGAVSATETNQEPQQSAEAEAPAANLAPLTLEPELRSDADWNADVLAEAEAVAEVVQAKDATTVAEAVAPASKAATLSAKIEALETAIGGIEDNFEPDEVGDDDYSGTEPPALSWSDDMPVSLTTEPLEEEVFATDVAHDLTPEATPLAVVPDVVHDEDNDTAEEIADVIAKRSVSDLQDPIEEAVFEAAAAAAADAQIGGGASAFDVSLDGKMLDDDALRDMVGDIVRSELQGALGERITRNVRKLVRREIHRALTTQDLE